MGTIVYEGKRFFKKSAPPEMNGKKLVFEEIFRSNYPVLSISEAEKKLNDIRDCHREMYGWVEFDAWLEHYPFGYMAMRYHAQYK